MTMNKYVGSRYVPLYLGTHDKTKKYEPLSIVSNEEKTKTYTSIQSVPSGTELDNTKYWAQSGYFQDGIVEITPDIAELASFEQPKLTVTKTDDDAEIKLEVADAYNAGASYGYAYVLNTLTTTGLYIIKPSACVEVPDAIASSNTPASLSVVAYDNNGTMNYMQQINTSDTIYMRTGDNETWNDWSIVSSSNLTKIVIDSYSIYASGKNRLEVNRRAQEKLTSKQAYIDTMWDSTTSDGIGTGIFIPLGYGLVKDENGYISVDKSILS